MSRRNTAVETVDDVTQVVGGDLIDDITPELGEIAGAAVTTVAATGRIGIRIVASIIRFVFRRPKEVLIGLVVVAAVMGVVSYKRSRADGAPVASGR